MMPDTIELFLQQAPCCVLVRTALEHLFDPQRLDDLFHDSADDQYQHELLFSELVHLMLAVVLGQKPSVRAAYLASDIAVSPQAVYDKLKRTDLEVIEALVADSATQTRAAVDALKAARPEPIRGRRLRILDGNRLTGTERRLKVLRDKCSRGLPGRALAVYEPATDLVTHVFLDPDGHAGERDRLGDVLELVRPGDLWVADRNFSTLACFEALSEAGGEFVVRQHGCLHGTPSGDRVACGHADTGEVFEEAIEVDGRMLRRLSLVLDTPTRDGETAIHVLTNVPKEVADGLTLMDVYRRRWSIEGRFYEMATTMNAEPKSLANPGTALFAFGLGLVASNAMALVRAALRAVHPADDVENMSRFQIASEVRETYRGMMIVLVPAEWRTGRCRTAAELAERLRRIAQRVRVKRYAKAKRGPKRPPTPRTEYQNGNNHSTWRLLEEQRIKP